MRLKDIQQVLDIGKSTASMLKNHKYDRPGSSLPSQYEALLMTVNQINTTAICSQCPRSDCTGCRVQEIQNV